MNIEMSGLVKMLNYIVVQNAHNSARLDTLLQATAHLIAKQEGTDADEELDLLMHQVNKSVPTFLADALDAINDVPDLT